MIKSQNFLDSIKKKFSFIGKNGKELTRLKPLCEWLKIDWNIEERKIKDDPILSKEIVYKKGFACLGQRFFYLWLFNVNADSEKLVEYQKECMEVLWKRFSSFSSDRN